MLMNRAQGAAVCLGPSNETGVPMMVAANPGAVWYILLWSHPFPPNHRKRVMSTFGRIFRVTTYGESHCASVGAIIDGCPPVSAAGRMDRERLSASQGLELAPQDIQVQLSRRRPGQSNLTTPVHSFTFMDGASE